MKIVNQLMSVAKEGMIQKGLLKHQSSTAIWIYERRVDILEYVDPPVMFPNFGLG